MLLSISTTHKPATDLGYLLAKHPDKCQSFDLAFGRAHVFYPVVGDERCTACLLLDIDPIGLVRGGWRASQGEVTLAQYVNDRPYVASSFLSVAIAQVLGSALHGSSKGRPELAAIEIPLEASISVVPCRGGEGLLRRLFEPLGYRVSSARAPLDEQFPEWGEGPYYRVNLARTARLADLLNHLYVLLPVLDDRKHYWIGRDELEKLLAKGEGWLARHPERAEIASRYLGRRRSLAREALERLLAEDDADPETTEEETEQEEETLEAKLTLNDQRVGAVQAVLEEAQARTVLDLGCGEGRLVLRLKSHKQFTKVVGVDVSSRSLSIARERLKLDRLSERQRARLDLFQSSLTYRDERFSGYDAACAVEVIEHIDPSRLRAFERVVFEFAAPRLVIITTPNVEYNVRFESMPAGKLRHRDHRFEWSRTEFESWARRVGVDYGYSVRFVPIGPIDPEVGAPTQMGVFSR
jgi:3' terminal RNA ribose 2'-O-methyltransferase Hen1